MLECMIYKVEALNLLIVTLSGSRYMVLYSIAETV